MGLLKVLKLKNLLKRVGNGIADSLPVLSTIKKNIDHDHSNDKDGNGFGKIDWVRLVVNLGTVALTLYVAYHVIKGNISISDAESLIKILK